MTPTIAHPREASTPARRLQPATPAATPCRGFVTELLLECGRGNPVAFGRLLDLLHPLVVATLRQRTPDASTQDVSEDDLVAAFFVHLWRVCPGYPISGLGAVAWVMDTIGAYEAAR